MSDEGELTRRGGSSVSSPPLEEETAADAPERRAAEHEVAREEPAQETAQPSDENGANREWRILKNLLKAAARVVVHHAKGFATSVAAVYAYRYVSQQYLGWHTGDDSLFVTHSPLFLTSMALYPRITSVVSGVARTLSWSDLAAGLFAPNALLAHKLTASGAYNSNPLAVAFMWSRTFRSVRNTASNSQGQQQQLQQQQVQTNEQNPILNALAEQTQRLTAGLQSAERRMHTLMADDDGIKSMTLRQLENLREELNASTERVNHAIDSRRQGSHNEGEPPAASFDSTAASLARTASQVPDERYVCRICFSSEVGLAFSPCGHLCTCRECGLKLQDCPFCRTPIVRHVSVYVPS